MSLVLQKVISWFFFFLFLLHLLPKPCKEKLSLVAWDYLITLKYNAFWKDGVIARFFPFHDQFLKELRTSLGLKIECDERLAFCLPSFSPCSPIIPQVFRNGLKHYMGLTALPQQWESPLTNHWPCCVLFARSRASSSPPMGDLFPKIHRQPQSLHILEFIINTQNFKH